MGKQPEEGTLWVDDLGSLRVAIGVLWILDTRRPGWSDRRCCLLHPISDGLSFGTKNGGNSISRFSRTKNGGLSQNISLYTTCICPSSHARSARSEAAASVVSRPVKITTPFIPRDLASFHIDSQ